MPPEGELRAAIVQDADTGRVLMLAWMDAEAERRTRESGEAWFWSRSREEYWRKGATSGNTLAVEELREDCDGDALLLRVARRGPAATPARSRASRRSSGARSRSGRRSDRQARTRRSCSTRASLPSRGRWVRRRSRSSRLHSRRATSGSSRRPPTSSTTSTCCSPPAASTSPRSRTSWQLARGTEAITARVRQSRDAGRRQGHPVLRERVGHRDQAGLRARRRASAARAAGGAALHARHLSGHVPRPAVDDPPVRGLRVGRGVERALPLPARAGADGALGRVRPADPARARLRRSARRGRGGADRGGDRLARGHGAAARRDPARPGVDLDDDQRARVAPPAAVRARRRRPGSGAGRAEGDGPERHPQGVRRARELHLPAAAVDAAHDRPVRVLRRADSRLEHDLDLRLPHPRGGLDRRAGARVHARERDRLLRGGGRGGARRRTCSASGCRSSSTRTTTSSRRWRSSARRAGCGRGSWPSGSA